MAKISVKKLALSGAAVLLVAGGVGAAAYAAQARHGEGHRGHGARWMEMMLEPMDADNNGSITRSEIETATAAQAAEIDSNKDGAITAEEVVAYREKQRLQRLANEIKAMDKDGNGTVSVQEYQAAQSWRLARLDDDGNGTIDPRELRPPMGPHDGMRHQQ
ncbi:MAG: EF-hand domain-containing protein [Dongiaceae bacterium]